MQSLSQSVFSDTKHEKAPSVGCLHICGEATKALAAARLLVKELELQQQVSWTSVSTPCQEREVEEQRAVNLRGQLERMERVLGADGTALAASRLLGSLNGFSIDADR